MAENKKTYTLEINGVKESISQVDALMESLKMLEGKIAELESKKINLSAVTTPINTTTATPAPTPTSTTPKQTLDNYVAEDRVLRRIWQTERQIEETQEQEYKNLILAKEELKQRVELGKEAAAQERLLAGDYANSMAGMKQELADIKRAMNFHDLDDVDWFDKQTKRANELTNKLKEIEASYGQYGRNVGNYANGVAQGLQKAAQSSTSLKVTINGMTREFSSARAGAMQLKNELAQMVLDGKKNTKEYKELEKTFRTLKNLSSDINKNAGAMSNLLKGAQSMTAMMSVRQGFSALFGEDNKELQESLQKLMALQTALTGLNTLVQQMQTGSFMGGLFKPLQNAFNGLFSSSKVDVKSNIKSTMESAARASGDLTKSLDKSKKAIEGMGGATKAAGAGLKEMSEAGNTAAAGLGNVTTNSMGAVASFEKLGTAMVKPQIQATLLQTKLNKLDADLTLVNTKLLEYTNELDKLQTKKLNAALNTEELKATNAEIDRLTNNISRLQGLQKEFVSQRSELIGELGQLSGEIKRETTAINENTAATENNVKAKNATVSASENAARSLNESASANERNAKAANEAAAANERLATSQNKTTSSVSTGAKSAAQAATGFNLMTKAGNLLITTFKMLRSMVWWTAIIYGATELLGAVLKLVKGNSDLIKSEELLKNETEQVNKRLQERLELNKQLDAGRIGEKYVVMAADEDDYAEALRESNELLEKRIKLQKEDNKIAPKPITSSVFGDSNRGIFAEGMGSVDEFVNRYNALSAAIEQNTKFVYKNAEGQKIASASTNKAKEQLYAYQQAIINDFVWAMKQYDLSTREGIYALDEFIKENDRLTGGIYSSALANMGNIIKNAGTKEALQQVMTQIESFRAFLRNSDAQIEKDLQNLIKGGLDVANKDNVNYWVKQIDDKYDKTIQAVKDSGRELTFEEIRQLSQGREAEKAEIRKSISSRLSSEANKHKKLVNQQNKLEDEFWQLRIKAMDEGLKKELAEIDANHKKELAKWKGNAEAIKLVNIIYDRDILNAKKKWAKEVRDTYQGLSDEIRKIMDDINNRNITVSASTVEITSSKQKDKAYENNIDLANPDDVNNARKYADEIVRIEIDANNKLYELNEERIKNEYEASKKEENLRHQNVLDLSAQTKVIEAINKNGGMLPDNEADLKKFEDNLKTTLKSSNGTLVDAYNSGKITFKEFVGLVQREQEAHNAKMDALEKERKNASEKNLHETEENNYKSYISYYDEVLERVKNSQDEIAKEQERGENKSRNTPFQILNLSEYTKTLNTARDKYTKLRKELVQEKVKLDADLKAKKIKPEDFTIKNKELDAQIESIDGKLEEINDKSKEKIEEFIKSLSQFVNFALQGMQDILSTVWDAEDAAYDKRIEALDKYINEYEEKLDKQREITEQYANEVDNIEDALATARGDRRQGLIDRLNAEMQAQRESLAMEKKMEKEKEKLEKKKEREVLEQKKKERQRNIITAIINTALGVTQALGAYPPPASYAFAAAVGALGAVQIGIMSSQKYADGGVLEGKSHREGGIKAVVGRNPIELEGQEYVIRKKSTTPNIDLLDYINKSERKLRLEDFIDFYTDGKLRKTVIKNSPKNKYATGGQIPSLRNDISVNDSLTRAFQDYANTPTVVEVREILNKADNVRSVQVLAGLTD